MENKQIEEQTIFLAKNLKLLRKKNNWSQEELANKVGLNRGNIASYEKGIAEPKICNLLKLSHLFNLSILDLTQKELTIDQIIDGNTTLIVANEHINEAYGQLQKLSEQATELQSVAQSLYTCHQHKVKNISEPQRETLQFSHNFEHLYQVTSQLLDQHLYLLNCMQGKQDPC